MPYVNLMRTQKYYIMEGKSKIEIVYFVFVICSLPFDFFNKLIKVFLMGQYLLMKYRVTNECRTAAGEIHRFIDGKTKSIGVINSLYNKGVEYAYKFATQDPRGQQ